MKVMAGFIVEALNLKWRPGALSTNFIYGDVRPIELCEWGVWIAGIREPSRRSEAILASKLIGASKMAQSKSPKYCALTHCTFDRVRFPSGCTLKTKSREKVFLISAVSDADARICLRLPTKGFARHQWASMLHSVCLGCSKRPWLGSLLRMKPTPQHRIMQGLGLGHFRGSVEFNSPSLLQEDILQGISLTNHAAELRAR